MSYYWIFNGTIKPKKDKIDQVAAILRKYGLGFTSGAEEGTFDIWDSTYGSDGYGYYLADELSSMLDEGEIDATNDDDQEHIRCSFQNGECSIFDGYELIYYPGYEEDFVEQLPEEVVDFIIRKGLKAKRPEFITQKKDMSRYWTFKGTLKPKKGKMKQAVAVLREYIPDSGFFPFSIPVGAEGGPLDFSGCSYFSDSDPDNLADALSSMLDAGELDVTKDDDQTHKHYAFQNGECKTLKKEKGEKI